MDFSKMLGGAAQGIGQGISALGGAINNVHNFFQQPNPYPNLKSPIPPSQQITHQLPPGVQSPIPQGRILPHPAGPSGFQAAVNNAQNAMTHGINDAQHNWNQWMNTFQMNPQQQLTNVPKFNAGHPQTAPTIKPVNDPAANAILKIRQAQPNNPLSDQRIRELYAQHGDRIIPQGQQQPAASQQGPFNPQAMAQNLTHGFTKYGGGKSLPILNHVNTFVQAAQQYPLFQQHPYILPAIAIKESSAGQSGTPLMGYGVHVGAPTDFDSQIMGAAHAIATMPAYQKFRQSGNPQDLINTYAPSTENNSALYAQQMPQFMGYFQ